MRSFLSLLLMLFASYRANSQTFELVEIDESVNPSPIHFRIKLPHQGFEFLEFAYRDYNNIPPTIVGNFLFKECKGNLVPSYYDTTVYMYDLSTTYGQVLRFYTLLDTNATDTNCIIRSTFYSTDTFFKQYPYLLGIAQVEKLSISLYPNPVRDSKIYLELAGISAKLQEVLLYTIEGKKVSLCTYNAADKIIYLPADVTAGNYILELVFTDGQRERRQVVVE